MSAVAVETAPAGTPFAESTIESGGFAVRTWQAGSGPTLVVLPGAGGYQPTYALDLLSQHLHVVVLEMPGWGDQPNDVADFDGLATQVAAFVTALGIESFHLMGTSLGGACAMHLVTTFPERVLSLVLDAPAKFRALSAHPSTLTTEQLGAAFRVHPERAPHPQPPDEAYMARIWPMIDRLMLDGSVDPAFAARLAACQTRTLIVFGYSDGLINPVNGRTIKQLMANSSLQYIFDAGHDAQCDRPEAFADLVGDFLRRGMGFMVNEQDGLINR
jgi:pimeloyl-ACP methyl ester carboxylesterase